VTDDRQTDHGVEKCGAIGEIACAEAIPPNNIQLMTNMTARVIKRMIRGRML